MSRTILRYHRLTLSVLANRRHQQINRWYRTIRIRISRRRAKQWIYLRIFKYAF